MIHINRPSSTRFIARVREFRSSRWTPLGKPTKSRSTAIRRLATGMISRSADIGEVAIVADYYDPVTVFEMRRK